MLMQIKERRVPATYFYRQEYASGAAGAQPGEYANSIARKPHAHLASWAPSWLTAPRQHGRRQGQRWAGRVRHDLIRALDRPARPLTIPAIARPATHEIEKHEWADQHADKQ
jgi:hypothetical protein